LFALNISNNGPFGRINIGGGTGGMTVWNYLVSKRLNLINTSHFLSFLTVCRVEHKTNTTACKAQFVPNFKTIRKTFFHGIDRNPTFFLDEGF